MENNLSIYEKTYQNYLGQLREIDFNSISEKLEIKVEANEAIIPLFGKPHRISVTGIVDPSGKQPSFDVCVILCKYILLCPHRTPKENEWVSFRGLKDSGPLINYFTNDVEQAISSHFEGHLKDLKQTSKFLGGYPPDLEVAYDLAMQFGALPKVPVVLLFNDTDDEFPVKCSVLFEKRAEKYIDAECIAIVGRLLFNNLKKQDQPPLP
jgi:hypothetical protein